MTKLEKLRDSASRAYSDECGCGDFTNGWDACQATLMPEIDKLVEVLEEIKKNKWEYPNNIYVIGSHYTLMQKADNALEVWTAFLAEEEK